MSDISMNPTKTLDLIKNGLLDPSNTWQSYLEENHTWKETAVALTLPLIVVSVVLGGILGWVFKSWLYGGIMGVLFSLIAAILWIIVASFIFSFLAGVFDGEHNFNRGFAALSLAAIPSYIGQILAPLPMVGWIISLGLGILGLVYLYKITPSYLKVPQERRVIHFIASLVVSVIVMFSINMVLGVGSFSSAQNNNTDYTSSPVSSSSSGLFGSLEQQGKLIENAQNDRFTPAKDEKITEVQMNTFVSYMKKSTEYINRQKEKVNEIGKNMDEKKEFSFSDLAQLGQNMGSVMSLANAEMEVVKSAGGNWAEHEWIKKQLRQASIHQELNDATKHNYALYEQHKDELKEYGIVY